MKIVWSSSWSMLEYCSAVQSGGPTGMTREMSSCLVLWKNSFGLHPSFKRCSYPTQGCSSCLHTSAPADERSWRLLPAGSDMSAFLAAGPKHQNNGSSCVIFLHAEEHHFNPLMFWAGDAHVKNKHWLCKTDALHLQCRLFSRTVQNSICVNMEEQDILHVLK